MYQIIYQIKAYDKTKTTVKTRLSFSPYILTVLGTEIVPLTPQ